MRYITNTHELRQFGIDPLTGEACAFSMRCLCDINQKGKELLESYLGVQGLTLREAWNHGDIGGTGDRIGSVMLDYTTMRNLLCYGFAMQGLGVVETKHELVILEGEDELSILRDYDRRDMVFPDLVRTYEPLAGSIAGRCVHQMSGRVE